MAPKSNPPAAKQALILSWFQGSGVAHSIKDLEKALPSVASINGMLVKDYLQALSDDNKIRIEKIGSGNWYWSFPSDEKRGKEEVLAKALEERDNLAASVEELRRKVDEAGAAREDEGESRKNRKAMTTRHAELAAEVDALKEELAGYSESDPMEVERKRNQMAQLKQDAEKWTEHIQSMEGWLKERMGGDKQQLLALKRAYYGDEFDEEEECLRDL